MAPSSSRITSDSANLLARRASSLCSIRLFNSSTPILSVITFMSFVEMNCGPYFFQGSRRLLRSRNDVDETVDVTLVEGSKLSITTLIAHRASSFGSARLACEHRSMPEVCLWPAARRAVYQRTLPRKPDWNRVRSRPFRWYGLPWQIREDKRLLGACSGHREAHWPLAHLVQFRFVHDQRLL